MKKVKKIRGEVDRKRIKEQVDKQDKKVENQFIRRTNFWPKILKKLRYRKVEKNSETGQKKDMKRNREIIQENSQS